MPSESKAVQASKTLLQEAGYTVLTTKSYFQAQGRLRAAELRVLWAEEDAEMARRWAENCLQSERQARERVNEVVMFAMEHGATMEDLVKFNKRLSTQETS